MKKKKIITKHFFTFIVFKKTENDRDSIRNPNKCHISNCEQISFGTHKVDFICMNCLNPNKFEPHL